MLLDEIKNISSGRKELRNFGLTFGIVLALAGGIMLKKGHPFFPYAFGGAAVFTVLALLWPAPLKPLQKIWMTLAVLMGFVMSRLILILLFFAILTPVSLIGRLFGKRFLDLKTEPGPASYWNPRDRDASGKADYTKQY